ncbi:MAG: ATP-binding protein [Phycisphaeraceae bacterium]
MPRHDSQEFRESLLHELCQLPSETEWVEFKCNNEHPEKIGEYISALANSAALCGKTNAYIVWGVSNESHEVVGTSFMPTQTKKGNEELENWLVRLLNPRIHFRILEFEVVGKRIAMIEIPRATHQPVQFQGIEHVRVGSYNKKLKEHAEKERELWRIFDVTPFEQQVAAARVEASDVLSLLDYPTYFSLLEIPLPETRAGILDRLADDQMIERGDGGGWNILNLGAILFASKLSAFPHLSRKAVRLIEYDGDGRTKTKREHQGHKGYAAGFEGLIGFLKAILPENEVIGEALRKSVPMYPELAIRELVANVIIHQDFTMTGTGPMVEVFDRRLEITNPGEPLVETQRFLDTPPQSRNESLASFLRRVNICEERGSGIDKVVSETEFYQLPAPLFEATNGHTRVVLFAHRDFADMDKADRIRACYLHACLQFVRRTFMTNRSLRKRFGISSQNRAQASRVIKAALEANMIRQNDSANESRKDTKYVPYWA